MLLERLIAVIFRIVNFTLWHTAVRHAKTPQQQVPKATPLLQATPFNHHHRLSIFDHPLPSLLYHATMHSATIYLQPTPTAAHLPTQHMLVFISPPRATTRPTTKEIKMNEKTKPDLKFPETTLSNNNNKASSYSEVLLILLKQRTDNEQY